MIRETYTDDAQWLAACLEGVGFHELAKQLRSAEGSKQYEQAMSRYNSTKNNKDNIKWHKTPDAFIPMLDDIQEYKVFHIMTNSCSVHNLIAISTQQLCDYLGYSKPTIIKAVKGLIKKGFIIIAQKGKKNEPTKYMVDPQIRTAGSIDVNALQKLFHSLQEKSSVSIYNIFGTRKPLYTYRKKINTSVPVKIDYGKVETLSCNYFTLHRVDYEISAKDIIDEAE